MKKLLTLILLTGFSVALFAQDEEEEKEKGFKKENLFTGGSISLGFANNSFLIGANPVFGYSLAKWVDAGIVVNYNYTSYRDYYVFDDRLRQSIYGGGVFFKLYPVRFLFLQAQPEHNFIKLKYIPADGSSSSNASDDVNSLLVGGGYTTGRNPGDGKPFFYLSVLVDVSGNENSPYTDSYGRKIPIIRGGIQVPLFQGQRSRY